MVITKDKPYRNIKTARMDIEKRLMYYLKSINFPY